MNERYRYVGDELDLFALAVNWKRYLRRQISPYIKGDVLEVGAGIGETTRALYLTDSTSWTCLEPDFQKAQRLRSSIQHDCLFKGVQPRILVGTIANIAIEQRFDSILYVDVLEHIENDKQELAQAAETLRPEGNLIVLAPAHNWLFTPFDTRIGHLRRYHRKSLLHIAPLGLRVTRVRYLDSAGLLASLGNRLVLRSSLPTTRQLLFWDRYLVRFSCFLDPLLAYDLGKSILVVWTK